LFAANPLKHIHPVGTVLLPGFLIAIGAPFVFGFAKPVPINPDRLRQPRRDIIWVALAGPAANILLACLSALLIHVSVVLPDAVAEWWRMTFTVGIFLNLVLAIFNMLPVPPLDGGRVLHGLLPPRYAERFARIERFGIIVVLVAFFIVPMIAMEFGAAFNPLAAIVLPPTLAAFALILSIFGVEALILWPTL
jgi:Zn-dependent protease